MSLYREPLLAKVKRLMGGEDTRPPANWPFPTYKGVPLYQLQGDAPPPKRRGPKATSPAPLQAPPAR